MQRRLSEMSIEELQIEAHRLLAEADQKLAEGSVSEAAILKKRYYFCLSYMYDPNQFKPGERYTILDDHQEFIIQYLNGVMAWGYINGDTSSELKAYPIGQLQPIQEKCAGGCNCAH
jgi:hypothetical protein